MQCVWNVKGLFWNMEVECFDVSLVINGCVRMTNLSIKHHANNLTVRLFIVYLVTGWDYILVFVARYAFVMSMLKVLPTQPKRERD